MPKLTKRLVDAIKPTETEQFVWDDDLPGFGVRVFPTGRKSYLIQYRAGNRTRRYSLRSPGTSLTATQARALARQKLAEVARGGDPSADRRKGNLAPTVKELSERYMQQHAEPKKKHSSIVSDKRLLRLVILPALGSMKAAEVTRADVTTMHHAHRETPIQANRAVSLLSKMLSLAERWGLRPDGSNPCRNIDRYKEKPRNRYLSAAELASLGAALTAGERSGTEHPSAVLAVRLLILTGCRRSEILHLRWEEVDLPAGVLALRDSKTGEKTVPLGAPAVELLSSATRKPGNPFVCWGEEPGAHLVGIDKAWRRIRSAAGLDDVRLHDLRHSFASVGVAGGFGLPIIGALLGHTTQATTARYAHLGADPRRHAAERIAGEIDAAMNPAAAEPPPPVLLGVERRRV